MNKQTDNTNKTNKRKIQTSLKGKNSMKIEDLLAPTWEERRNASTAIFAKLDLSNECLKKEIEALKPSPEIFFSKLIAYWADVSLLEFRDRMKGTSYIKGNDDFYLKLSNSWQSPYESDVFVKFKVESFDFPAMMVWMFIGKIANTMDIKIDKKQLLACLKHPEMSVNETINKLLLYHEEMNDESFLNILIEADKKGHNGTREDFWNRSDLIIKYLNEERLNILLKDIHTNISLISLYARLGVLNRLDNKVFIAKSYEYLYAKIDLNWTIEQRIEIFYSLASMSKQIGFKKDFLLYIQNYIEDKNPSMRSCVVYILIIHSPFEHLDMLKKALINAHCYVLLSFCRGLFEYKEIPSELFYQTISQSLDNYDAGDEEPHYSAIQLIISQGEKSFSVLEFIKKWLDTLTLEEEGLIGYDFDPFVLALELVESLKEYGDELKPIVNIIAKKWLLKYDSKEEALEVLEDNYNMKIPKWIDI